MSRKTRNGRGNIWVSELDEKARWREAEKARLNRFEIQKALNSGQISRRDLIKWGLFTSAGLLAPIGGLNPLVRSVQAFSSGGGGSGVPTGLPASPLFGATPFTSPMYRMDLLSRNAVGTLNPAPTQQANTTQQPVDPLLVGGQTGLTGPIEGRPPGAEWAHQGWTQFPPQVAVEVTTQGCLSNAAYNPGVASNLNSGINPTVPIPPSFQPQNAAFPVQEPNSFWTFTASRTGQGSFPAKLVQVRYAEPVLFRHHNGLSADITQNNGFGRHTLTTHEHNAHHGAENDGFTGAYFFPNEFYDYHWPWTLAGWRSINTGATDPRAGTPNGSGGITNIPGDYRETMSSHWFHDHMFTFTDQNVYKGDAGMNNIYSSLDRGNEGVNDGVNLRLPSGTENDYGNLDYDVNLLIADKAWDSNGQLAMDTCALQGFLGDQMTINFIWKPFFQVQRRKYRFRLLNASVSRFFAWALSDSSSFTMIANDGNLLPNVVPMTQTDQQGIAERYDIVIDFSKYSIGQSVYLVNLQEQTDGAKPDPSNILTVSEAMGGNSSDPAVGPCLRFDIVANPPTADQSQVPSQLIPNPTIPAITRQRTFQFGNDGQITTNDPVTTYEGNGCSRPGPWAIATNNNPGGSNRDYSFDNNNFRSGSQAQLEADFGRVSAQPGYATAEQWTLIGGFGWDHPIHIHFEEGQIIARNGQASQVPAWEKGRKDVYRLRIDGSVTLNMQFRDWGGMFMEHCHNTMHEDNAMLLRWDINNAGSPLLNPLPTPIPAPTGVTFEQPDEILAGA